MSDKKAHLSVVKPELVEDQDDHIVIKMVGRAEDGYAEFQWTRQKRGMPLKDQPAVGTLQQMMQDLMKGRYSVIDGETCHQAQERLRKALGVL